MRSVTKRRIGGICESHTHEKLHSNDKNKTIKEKIIERRLKKESSITKWLEGICFNNQDVFFDSEKPYIITNMPKQFIRACKLVENIASNNGLDIDITINHNNCCYIIGCECCGSCSLHECVDCVNECDYACTISINTQQNKC